MLKDTDSLYIISNFYPLRLSEWLDPLNNCSNVLPAPTSLALKNRVTKVAVCLTLSEMLHVIPSIVTKQTNKKPK